MRQWINSLNKVRVFLDGLGVKIDKQISYKGQEDPN